MSSADADTDNATSGGKKPSPPRRAKEIFGDCALVEIIHLHDCFRGALRNLEVDVTELCREMSSSASTTTGSTAAGLHTETRINDLERRVAGRFTVIWSVFRAHSAAEDEFIWPALKAKQVSLPNDPCGCNHPASVEQQENQPQAPPFHNGQMEFLHARAELENPDEPPQDHQQQQRERAHSVHRIEQEEYEEDHADEEKMFNSINGLLSNVRDELSNRTKALSTAASTATVSSSERGGPNVIAPTTNTICKLAQSLLEATRNLMRHLMTHLDKEETHCMPLVMQYLTKAEINDLVGKIMGKRSSQLMSQILTMAIQNLNEADRDDMVHYMKQAMVGTFFERWLKMGGWMEKTSGGPRVEGGGKDDGGGKMPIDEKQEKMGNVDLTSMTDKISKEPGSNMAASLNELSNETGQPHPPSVQPYAAASASTFTSNCGDDEEEATDEKYTSATELQKLIRAIGTNPHLDAKQKTLTIQGLRDSVWKSNCRLSKRKREVAMDAATALELPTAHMTRPIPNVATSATAGAMSASFVSGGHASRQTSFPISSGVSTRFKRETPPSSYYKKNNDGEFKLVWSSSPHSTQFHPNDGSVPLFSASELAPTYHDGGIHQCLGCPHYARSCKLRHPTSGRLYTCRLCCEQRREMATNNKDSPLDRYEVKEVLCMICGALQPASDKCVNTECNSSGKPFARYSCNICNFYDDSSSKSTYHCPFCNVCRSGQGLGIDYYHCMRCNACVSIKDEHHCIPQRLQGNCPICHESMFESTEPLRGLRCGHVMHLGCFSMYMRGQTYTCPLCKKSAEDMSEYFTLLDSAVRMQPMPPAYSETTSNIYCQDCCQMGKIGYHFVGLKCQHCGSYNTRELQRVDALWNNAPPWP